MFSVGQTVIIILVATGISTLVAYAVARLVLLKDAAQRKKEFDDVTAKLKHDLAVARADMVVEARKIVRDSEQVRPPFRGL